MSVKKTAALSNDFAVILTGGKQYPVSVGQIISVEKLGDDLTPGSTITFDSVLLTVAGSQITVGTPTVPTKVTAEFIENGKEDKIRVTRFKSKSNRHRTYGHRQPYSKVKITAIA
jgi:large subunit ribosomal protein L21